VLNQPEAVAPPNSYRADIDGLRAIAVAAVVAYHTFPRLLPAGFLGVDVFFVISGFLITRLILADIAQQRFQIARFYSRRIRRIFPALIVVLGASFLLGWRLLLPSDFAQLGADIVGAVLFVANFQAWFEGGYFDRAAELKPLLHLWSLGVEEQFYLIWPPLLLLAAGWRIGARNLAIALGLASFLAALALDRNHPDAAFYLPFTRFWELMIGAVLANVTRPSSGAPQPSWVPGLGLALVVLSCAGLGTPGSMPAWFRALPTVGTGILIFAGPDNWISRSILSNRAAVWLGKISYPLYLWHWPLLYFLRVDSPGKLHKTGGIAVIAVSVGFAWLTYLLVERPTRFGKLRPVAAPALTALLALCGAAGVADYRSQGVPSRYPQPIRDYLTLGRGWLTASADDCWLTWDDGDFKPGCTPTSAGTKPTLWLWGDSHAALLYQGLVAEYGGALSLGQLTRSGCPPIFLTGSDPCIRDNELVVRRIEKSAPDTLVMLGAWNQYGLNFRDNATTGRLSATIARVKLAGVKRVLLIGPMAQWTENLPKVLFETWRNDVPAHRIPTVTNLRLDSSVFEIDRQLAELAAANGIEYFSLVARLCGGSGCLARTADGPDGLITGDYGHLTASGAVYVARLLPLAP